MKKDNIVAFRVSIYDHNPNKFYEKVKPKKCKSKAWIPQTIGDQVWIWFEFDDKTEKMLYEASVSNYRDMFMHKEKWLTQKEIWHWTETPEQEKARKEYNTNLESRYKKEGLCKEFQAVIDCMSMKPNMDDEDERRIVLQSDDATRDLVDSGVWDKLENFYIYASKLAKNKHDTNIDWKNPK